MLCSATIHTVQTNEFSKYEFSHQMPPSISAGFATFACFLQQVVEQALPVCGGPHCWCGCCLTAVFGFYCCWLLFAVVFLLASVLSESYLPSLPSFWFFFFVLPRLLPLVLLLSPFLCLLEPGSWGVSWATLIWSAPFPTQCNFPPALTKGHGSGSDVLIPLSPKSVEDRQAYW